MENILNTPISTEGLDIISGLVTDTKVKYFTDISNKAQQTEQNIFSATEFSGDVTKIMDAKSLDYNKAYDSVVDYYKQKGYTVKGFESEFEEVEVPTITEEPVRTTEPIVEEKPGILDVAFDLGEAFDVAVGGVTETVSNIYKASKSTALGLFKMADKLAFDSGNAMREAMGKKPLSIEEAKSIEMDVAGGLETTIQEDLLDVGQGSLQLGLTSVFPVATLAFTTAGETKEGEKILQSIGKAIEVGGSFITKIPGLSDYRDSLPENRRADFDSFIGQGVTLGLFKAGSKVSEIRAKWNKANVITKQAEIAGKIARPTKGEIKSGLLESGEKGITTIAKQTGKEIKDFAGLQKSIKPIKEKIFTPLKKGLDDAQAQLIKTEKTGLKGLTQDGSISSSLTQLVDVLEGAVSKKNVAIRKEVLGLMEKHQTKGLTLNEIQKVKQLHTEQNRLFTEKGELRGKTISMEDLRGLRKDLKDLLEVRATEGGFKDVKSINTKYGEILSAEQLLKERVAEVKVAKLRTEEAGLIGKLAEFVGELPGVKQILTKPAQELYNKIVRGSADRKISITELEAQLPSLLKELRQIGEPKGNISKLIGELKRTFPALSEISTNY